MLAATGKIVSLGGKQDSGTCSPLSQTDIASASSLHDNSAPQIAQPSESPSRLRASHDSAITISKGNLVGRVLNCPNELEKAQRLRHRVFVEKLKWIEGRDGLDLDDHDEGAVVFGVFEGHILRGCVRVVLPHKPFMLERDFRGLLNGQPLWKRMDTVEVSRFVIDPDMTDARQRRRTVLLLHYLIYTWVRRNGVRRLYFVSSHKLIAALRRSRGLPIETFGTPALTRDRVSYQAALVNMGAVQDWRHRLQYWIQYLAA